VNWGEGAIKSRNRKRQKNGARETLEIWALEREETTKGKNEK